MFGKIATIEILHHDEKIFGSSPNGQYYVRRFENKESMGGSFFKTMEEAEVCVREYQEMKP